MSIDHGNFVYVNRSIEQHAANVGAGTLVASQEIPWFVPQRCLASYRTKRAELIKVSSWSQSAAGPENAYALAEAECAGQDDNFVALSMSGGGIKAAVYSAAVMFELADYGLLQQVDALSSVSGSSFTALLYGLSCDPRCESDTAAELPRPRWTRTSIIEHLDRGYRWPWWIEQALPDQSYLKIATYHDSGDSFVNVLRRSFFEDSDAPQPLGFANLNPARPNIFVNATNSTENRWSLENNPCIPAALQRKRDSDAHLHFAFTREQFVRIGSSLDEYPLANALVASAAFPLIIDQPTLRNFILDRDECRGTDNAEEKYIHLTDGGVHDNNGLIEYRWFLECLYGRHEIDRLSRKEMKDRCGVDQWPLTQRTPAEIIVFDIDASVTRSLGTKPNDPDPRNFWDWIPIRILAIERVVDMRGVAAGQLRKRSFDNLLLAIGKSTRTRAVRAFVGLETLDPRYRSPNLSPDTESALEKLFEKAKKIKTDFDLDDGDSETLREAAQWVVALRIHDLCEGENKWPKLHLMRTPIRKLLEGTRSPIPDRIDTNMCAKAGEELVRLSAQP